MVKEPFDNAAVMSLRFIRDGHVDGIVLCRPEVIPGTHGIYYLMFQPSVMFHVRVCCNSRIPAEGTPDGVEFFRGQSHDMELTPFAGVT